MTQSPSFLGVGLCTVAGALLPFLADASAAVSGASSLEVFGRWVQAGGTVGMVGVLLWIRKEEKERRENEESKRDQKEDNQWKRYDALMLANREDFKRLADLSEKFSLRVAEFGKGMDTMAVEIRILHESLPPDTIRKVVRCAEINSGREGDENGR